MKLKFNGILVLLLALITQIAMAQERTVTGIVLDDTGMPLPGASILVKETKAGTQSDFDGKFAIKASAKQTLIFTYIGMETIEVKASSSTLTVKLKSSSTELEGVVVTAFGIKRNPKNLGYSVSAIKSDEITENSEPDLIRSLSGKVAGVNVNFSNGTAGAANQITIRGISTFTGNTQPLIIVDGIAYDNSQINTSEKVTGGGGGAYESALSSLDPNNIASVNVLKSTTASALYGSRAVNGVIVITTKTGSTSSKAEKFKINFGSSTYFEEIANLPDYQNTYGAGTRFSYENVNGSWGPRFDSLETIPTWPSLLEAFPEYGPTVPYVAKPNNVKDLFRTGKVIENTVGFNYSGTDGNFSTTISDLRQDGYIPYNSFDRTSVSVGGNFKLSQKLTFGGNMSYSTTDQIGGFTGNQQFDGNSSSFARSLILARNWDLNLPYENPATGASITPNATSFDHPLWSLKHDQIITNTSRTVAGINIQYEFNKNISASYRAGINRYNLNRMEIRDLNSRADSQLGSLKSDEFNNEDIESTFLLNLDYQLTEDIGLKTILGHNVLQNNNSRLSNYGKQFKVPDVFNFSNVLAISNLIDDSYQKRNIGVFADLTFSYKDYLFINTTGRNDWSSTLPKSNNSYFYPSISASFIITDALNMDSNVLTFAKIRGGYAKTARDAESEFLNTSFILEDAYNSFPTIGNSASLSDQNIKPEFTTEFEIGTDLEFFNRRIALDVSLYKKNTTNLITPITVPESSGYQKFNTNLGEMENKGIEIGLTLVPVQTEQFKWSLYSTFTKNKNKVIELIEGLDRFPLDIDEVAYVIPGQAFGVFYGTKFARDNEGNFIINKSTGGIVQSQQNGIIGDPNADFKMSFINTFSYKGFTLKSQFDWKQGGDIKSTTITDLLGRGVTKDTENREGTYIIPGYYGDNEGNLTLDSSNNKIPNTTQISLNEMYFSPSGSNTFGINSVDEASIYDGTVFRLRELSLTYAIPAKYLKKTPFGQISLSAIGSNLWYFAPNVPKYTNFDPEITSYGSSNLQGIEVASAPTAKRYGFKLNLTF
ncbi:SusC/RagA family TonB-linked outer membrane protein [Flavobacterium sp. UMI-01]|uniref:SusC/RagA family TonB-linked outer membrane protein n=1 Tax=Flavobacterium sp. UMI-01 TaxID=1441053 RepID=UPI001C7CFFC3|nr:SusC/RagA family TonB-linked outer membrane protein [Flavobacterium sp. UMI-01]GIZ07376.1 SusC/RagA family TonB-linked outer membrane protein [Flavobacterium sp. UMI-01]